MSIIVRTFRDRASASARESRGAWGDSGLPIRIQIITPDRREPDCLQSGINYAVICIGSAGLAPRAME
jgi:hypothetical protein